MPSLEVMKARAIGWLDTNGTFAKKMLVGLRAPRSTFHGSTFIGCEMTAANLAEAKLSEVIFESCLLAGAVFHGASLRGVTFIGCNLDAALFAGATLENVRFENCTMRTASFEQAVACVGVVFSGGSLEGADLRFYDAPKWTLSFEGEVELYAATVRLNCGFFDQKFSESHAEKLAALLARADPREDREDALKELYPAEVFEAVYAKMEGS